MSRNQTAALFFLLGLSMPAIACDDDGGERREEVDAAVDVCLPLAEQVTHCYGDGYESLFLVSVGACVAELGYADYDGPDCRAAQEDYYACIGALDCKDLKSDDDQCSEESAAVDEACDESHSDADSGDEDSGD